MFVMIVSSPGGGYAPRAQYPRCEPPLISIFGGMEPPLPTWTAVWPPYPDPMSTLVNLYPGVLDAFTTIPYCIVSRSILLPVPYPQRGLWDVSGESANKIPVKRVKTMMSLISKLSTRPIDIAVELATTHASMGLGTGTFSHTSQVTETLKLCSMTCPYAWSMWMSL